VDLVSFVVHHHQEIYHYIMNCKTTIDSDVPMETIVWGKCMVIKQ
jgi:hypothetical protein